MRQWAAVRLLVAELEYFACQKAGAATDLARRRYSEALAELRAAELHASQVLRGEMSPECSSPEV